MSVCAFTNDLRQIFVSVGSIGFTQEYLKNTLKTTSSIKYCLLFEIWQKKSLKKLKFYSKDKVATNEILFI